MTAPACKGTGSNDHGKPLIIFDGHCSLCSVSAEFVVRRDHTAKFLLTTAQSPTGRQSYLSNGLDPDAMTTMIVIEDGVAHTQSDAVLRVLATLGWPWRAAAVARIVPRGLRDIIYRWLVRNRYRLMKRRDTCWLPDAALRDRVL